MNNFLNLALAVFLALAAAPAPARAEPVAVIVNRDNPKHELGTEELKSIYMGRRTEWSDGTAAQPIDQAPSAPGRAAFVTAVLGMSAERFAEHWVDQQVRGAGAAPKVAASPAAAVKLVAKLRGAVAFVPLSQVTPAVRVVALNGRMPGERGYPMP
jgi:ABC-type phosphate transport system substrate-binding protein